MSDRKIVASASRRSSAVPTQSELGWAVFGWIGLSFLAVGGLDFALLWFPLNLGNREWEFGTVTQSFNGLPILLLGIGLLVVASHQLERGWWRLVALAAALLLIAWVIAGTGLWLMNVQLALATVPEELQAGVHRAVAKTSVQAIVYVLLLTYLIRQAWKQS